MKTGSPRFFRRSLAATGFLSAVLTACTCCGGGYLHPSPSRHWQLLTGHSVRLQLRGQGRHEPNSSKEGES
jgi:hypothetical protein